jgi:hypothetical protein
LCTPQVVRAGDAEFSFAATHIKALSQELGTEGVQIDSEQRVLRFPVSATIATEEQ